MKLTITDRAKHSKSHGSGDTTVELLDSNEARAVVPAKYVDDLIAAYSAQKPNMFGVKHASVDDEWGQYTYLLSSTHPELRNEKKISKLKSAKR